MMDEPKKKKGQRQDLGTAEYVLIVVLIVIVALVILLLLPPTIGNVYSNMGPALNRNGIS